MKKNLKRLVALGYTVGIGPASTPGLYYVTLTARSVCAFYCEGGTMGEAVRNATEWAEGVANARG